MIKRLARVRREFGTVLFLRVLVLLAALIVMPVLGWFWLGTPLPAVVSIAGLLLGYALRAEIVDHRESLTWAVPIGLTVYGIVLTAGEKLLGFTHTTQLLIITITTVIVFDIQFWWLSDPEVINTEK